MLKTLDILRDLAMTASRNEKEKIIADAFLSGNREFFTAAKLAYDKLISFGVARVPEIAFEDLNETDFGTFTFSDFLSLTDKLRKRQLTGHAARDAINAAAMACHGPTWNELYRRIILKDMKIGCDEKTINKVLTKLIKAIPEAKNWLIPVFECQLAHDGEDETHQKKIKGKKLLDAKIDGCLSHTWTVEFEDGRILTIGEVVHDKIEGKIKSYDSLNQKMVFNKIIGWAKNGFDANEEDNYSWFILTLENGIVLPPLTGNHLIYLPMLECWRRVDMLKEGDILLSHTENVVV